MFGLLKITLVHVYILNIAWMFIFPIYLKLTNPPPPPPQPHRNFLFFFIRTFLNQTSQILKKLWDIEIHIETAFDKTAQYSSLFLTLILYLIDFVEDITTS